MNNENLIKQILIRLKMQINNISEKYLNKK